MSSVIFISDKDVRTAEFDKNALKYTINSEEMTERDARYINSEWAFALRLTVAHPQDDEPHRTAWVTFTTVTGKKGSPTWGSAS
jgi:hypothetical protein